MVTFLINEKKNDECVFDQIFVEGDFGVLTLRVHILVQAQNVRCSTFANIFLFYESLVFSRNIVAW